MANMLDHALRLAAEGFRVFPLAEGTKIPIKDMKWKASASTDPVKIRAMWTVKGKIKPFNIGVALDANVIVVDVDVRDGKRGAEALALIEVIYDPLPVTYRTRTSSKGDHHYYKVDPTQGPFSKELTEHVDLKTIGGYVVGEGSIVDGKRYARVGTATPAQMQPFPKPYVDLAKRSVKPKATKGAPLVDEDQPEQIERAKQWLHDRAPDSGTYAVAARVKDFGISEPQALDLLMSEWVEPRNLGKSIEHVEFRVRNAYRYGQNAVGVADPEAEFGPVEVIDRRQKPKTDKSLSPGHVSLVDMKVIPPRQWLYGHKLSRKYTAFAASPGGVGKTAWVTTVALSCASGRQLLHDKPHHPMRVWMYNLEDDINELRRRVQAAMTFHDLPPETLTNFRLNSGRQRGLKVVSLKNDAFVVMPDANELADRMLEEQIELLIVDPFLRSHGVPENATEAQDEVMRVYADIAEKANASVLLVHHTRKGAVAGDQESMRGSSTQGGAARSVFMLTPMTPEEAGRLGITEAMRRLHVRVDDAKNNMSPPAGQAEWIRLASVSLNNATKEYPNGDSVQVARSWIPPSAWEGIDLDEAESCLKSIIEGMPDGERYSIRSQDKTRWAGSVLVSKLDRSENQAKEIIKGWLASSRIVERVYASKTQRKTRKGIFAP